MDLGFRFQGKAVPKKKVILNMKIAGEKSKQKSGDCFRILSYHRNKVSVRHNSQCQFSGFPC